MLNLDWIEDYHEAVSICIFLGAGRFMVTKIYPHNRRKKNVIPQLICWNLFFEIMKIKGEA